MDHLWDTLYEVVVFEAHTVVVMKGSVFWDIIPCSPFNGEYGIMSQKIKLFTV
jgi:hypothetical protein